MHVEEIPPRVVLRGAVIDEPHLLGIIDQLRVLGLSLVSVRPMTSPGRAKPTGTPHPPAGTGAAARRSVRRTSNRSTDHD
jgi:hypothetical protein